MSYTEFQDYVLPLFFFYIALIVFSIFMTVKMFLKWRERNVKPPLHLSVVFALFSIALIGLTIGLGEAVITRYYMELYRFSLPFAYSTMIIADIFLFLFASEITNRGRGAFVPLIIVGIALFVVLYLPWNWWGVPQEDYAGQLNIRLYSTLGLIVYSYIIYIFIAITCFRARKKADDGVARLGLSLLLLAMICMVCFFLMMVIDTLLITLTDHPGYSAFVYYAWIFAIIFYILSYFSLVMPDWVVKRIKKSE
jgi:hypothetical protein